MRWLIYTLHIFVIKLYCYTLTVTAVTTLCSYTVNLRSKQDKYRWENLMYLYIHKYIWSYKWEHLQYKAGVIYAQIPSTLHLNMC